MSHVEEQRYNKGWKQERFKILSSWQCTRIVHLQAAGRVSVKMFTIAIDTGWKPEPPPPPDGSRSRNPFPHPSPSPYLVLVQEFPITDRIRHLFFLAQIWMPKIADLIRVIHVYASIVFNSLRSRLAWLHLLS